MIYRLKLARLVYLVLVLGCQIQFFSVRCLGDLLVGTAFEGGVRRVDEATGAVLPGGVAPGSAGLAFTSGVAVGPDGNIYVSSRGTGEVLFYDGHTGAPLPSPHAGERAGLFATLATPTTPNSVPGPLRFGPDGNLYVSDFGGSQVWRFNGATGDHIDFIQAVLAGPPAGLTFAPDGDLYVGDFSTASIQKVDENGTTSFFVQPGQGGSLESPSSLLFLPNGHLLVVDLFGNQILKFDQNGQNPTQFALIPPAIPNPLPPGVTVPSNNPSDIAFDSNGNIVVAVLGLTNPPDNRGALLRYDQNGNLLQTVLNNQTPFGSVARIDPVSHVSGDYDRNGLVQAADYTKWRADFGRTVISPGLGADGNRNGIVDAADYAVWRGAISGGAGIGAVVVPEPGTIVMLLCGAFLVGAVRMRNDALRSRR